MIVSVFLTDSSGGRLFDATICQKAYYGVADDNSIASHLWKPDEMGITTAKQMIAPLEKALALLAKRNLPDKSFENWLGKYLAACKKEEFADALVVVMRRPELVVAEEKKK